MGWLLVENRLLSKLSTYEKYARDVLQDPFYLWIERRRMWAWIYLLHAVLFFVVGLAIGWIATGTYAGGAQFGLSLLLWGVIFRTIYTWHVTWAINSASHMWGYRSYDTHDDSRNLWWVGLLAWGEGWHNTHHAFQRSARHGFEWWELDATWLAIRFLAAVGLAKDIHLLPKNSERFRIGTEDEAQAAAA